MFSSPNGGCDTLRELVARGNLEQARRDLDRGVSERQLLCQIAQICVSQEH